MANYNDGLFTHNYSCEMAEVWQTSVNTSKFDTVKYKKLVYFVTVMFDDTIVMRQPSKRC